MQAVAPVETILVVDPDDRRGSSIRDILDRAGYDVRIAADEGQAAAVLDRWQPAVVVAPTPPRDGLAHLPTVTVFALDRADLLAAIWVALNP